MDADTEPKYSGQVCFHSTVVLSTDMRPMVRKHEPASAEQLIDKRRREQEEASKPRFMTREQRAQLASKQAEDKEALLRLEQEREKARREEFLKKAAQASRSSDQPGALSSKAAPELAGLTENERQAIKDRFLRPELPRKKARRIGDKRFNFDWAESDDTSHDINPLYAEKVAISRRIAGYEDPLQSTLDERHWSEKKLGEMRDRDWRIFKEDFSISTQGGSVPSPIRSWAESGLPREILRVLDQAGYDQPTAIQRQAIPLAMHNRDMIGLAETGSGKTAAFILPMLCFIMRLPKMSEANALDGPYALVLAPSRELALQIEQEAKKFAKPLGYNVVAIVGGHSVTAQSFNMRNGAEIVIATPGRLRDCLDQHVLALSQCSYVVLDEADRMIDMNFEDDLRYILDSLPLSLAKPDSEAAENPEIMTQGPYRHTTMFSATMPPAIERLAKTYLRRPVMVIIGQIGQAVESIEQRIEMITDERKASRLQELLKSHAFKPPIIVFVNQKRTVDYVQRLLDALGLKSVSLHGGKSQEQREAAIASVRKGLRDILVATDVAGRGIDIKDVSLVINFDMAKTIEDYVHRIGRTGRAGKMGVAITFLTSNDTDVFFDLKNILRKSPRSIIPPELAHHEAAKSKPGAAAGWRREEERLLSIT